MTTINDGGPMTDRYERIRAALAMGPTPGPWGPVTDRQYSDLPYLVLGAGSSDEKSTEWMPLYVHVGGRSGWMEQEANTLLIAACDSDTIRELLVERDALAAEVERLSEALRGWWEAYRPVGWTEDQHRSCPHVNLATATDKALADAMLRAREASND